MCVDGGARCKVMVFASLCALLCLHHSTAMLLRSQYYLSAGNNSEPPANFPHFPLGNDECACRFLLGAIPAPKSDFTGDAFCIAQMNLSTFLSLIMGAAKTLKINHVIC
jgi:hypothetical protein